MPAPELPKFYAGLSRKEGASFRALQFMILTLGRTKEVLGATWSEIDLEAACWSIPGVRMKMDRDHRVPLSNEAVALVRRIHANSCDQYLFPSRMNGRHLSNMACLIAMRKFGLEFVPHGFRSTFKDWATEDWGTEFPDFADILSERALAHVEKNKTKAAYKRGDLFERRKPLMEDWGKFCTSAL